MKAKLDPGFQPAVLVNRAYRRAANEPLVIALERENGLISRYETVVKQDTAPDTFRYVERLVKFLLWSRGGWKIHFGGPRQIGEHVRQCYSLSGTRAFDAELMTRVYGRPFEVTLMQAEEVPAEHEVGLVLGGHLDGCRIGFDLGASDYKIGTVVEGELVFSAELPWNPRVESDPEYHYQKINEGLRLAAKHMPRVDAIGGSTAGVVVENRIMVASLFRAVPREKFSAAQDIFLRLRKEWGVPLEVANDGDVTALAGAMSLNANALLGVAMGSSEAAGFLDGQGRIRGWLSELAFAPVDFNPDATPDEWSGDRGIGALYFSQQAVNRLLPAAGIDVPKEMDLPGRLKEVQRLIETGDERAARIYETIGVYFGYTIPLYAEFYDLCHLLVLGRVTSGEGGNILVRTATEILRTEFPDLAEKISVHVPDEKSRRVGQAVAAASLPALERRTP